MIKEEKKEMIITYPEPPQELVKGKFKDLVKYFGPGAIMASITVGSGEVFFSSRGGAVFEYAILWAFVVGAIMKGIMTYTANRYITLTGEHPMTRWAYIFPGPKGWFPLMLGILSIMCFPFWEGGLGSMLGNFMVNNTHVLSQAIWGTILVWGAFLLFITGSYERMEKIQTFIVAAMVISVLAAVIAAKPDWLKVLTGSIIPQIPSYDPWIVQKYPSVAARPVWVEIVTYMGAIGGGTYDYIGYTGLLREKGWGALGREDLDNIREYLVNLKPGERIPLSEDPEEVKKGLTWTKAALADNVVSYGLLVLFTIGFMVNGAVILHSQQLIPADNDLLTYQVKFLQVIHPMLTYLYYVAVFLALFGTMYGVYIGYTYTTYETFSPVIEGIRKLGVRRLQLPIALYVAIGGTIAIWTGANPVSIITPASLIGGVLTGGIWCLAMYWTDRKMLPKAYQLNTITSILLVISGIVLTCMGIVGVLQYFKII